MNKTLIALGVLVAMTGFARADSLEAVSNCDALTGKSGVCVFNNAKQTIRTISCDNTGWTGPSEFGVMIPRGSILAGHMTIIDFDAKGDCAHGLHVVTNDGRRHDFVGQDTKTATVLSIDGDF